MSSAYAPPNAPLTILHEDADLVLVDKPSGLLSVPGKGPHLADCLLARLERARPGTLLVHRLDRDTSGVMVFARTKHAQRHLGLQFERRHMQKRYIACVSGAPEAQSGTIDLPLIADWPNRPRQKVDWEQGKRAVTHWEVLSQTAGVARLALVPETGRSHQLRVHLAELGHPILGDPLYGGAPAPRLMLHAERLSLRHPQGGARVAFHASCPF